MVIDEIFAKKGTELLPIDSIENQPIDEVIYEGQHFHIASQNDLTGTSEIVADNGVAEPIRSLEVSGNTIQNGTPSPDAPCPIENANSEGMTVTVHGDNIIDQYALLSNSNMSKTIYNGFECLEINKAGTYTFPCEIPAGTKARITWEMAFPKGIDTYWFFKYEDGTYSASITSQSALPPKDTFAYYKPIDFQLDRLFTKKIVGLQMRFYGGANSPYMPAYIKNLMINIGTEFLPYEPYFRDEISIPTSVEVDGATVDLNMASVSLTSPTNETKTATDYLSVDRVSNKVLYHQSVGKKTLTSTNMNWVMYTTGAGKILFYSSTDIGMANRWLPVLSNKYVGYAGVNYITSRDYGITSDALWWNGSWKCALTIRDTRFDNLADFKADIDQNPLEIEYGLATPITHDITNTELGQSLLTLATGKGTNYLEITGHLDPSQTDLSYWQKIITNE